MQLVESAQKLKAFYNSSRNAPAMVADICFELETMSLSLRQLEIYRRPDSTANDLLVRCILTCERMTRKIRASVAKIERLLQRSRSAGRLYMAFKEPEIRGLLEEMEHAKSSMAFAYMSYCQCVPTPVMISRALLTGAKLLECWRDYKACCSCELAEVTTSIAAKADDGSSGR